MSEQFYSDARLYDRLFAGGEPAIDFYRSQADRQGERVLELGCGTGDKLIPIASDGHRCMGLELSPHMLAEARRKADERDVEVEWVQGDMRDFHAGRTFDLVFIAANSLLHLHEAEELVACFRSVRRHLAPGGRLVFDVFNPSLRMLAEADGVRRRRDALSFVDPGRGVVHVDVAETYDAAAQVTHGRWYFSTDVETDFMVAPLEIRSIFPQELPLLLALGGLRVVERFGDWSRAPLTASAALQLYVCQPDQVVLRPMLPADVPAVLAVQQPGAVTGLAQVFPQDEFPFPREAVARRWLEEIDTRGIDCLVVEKREEVIGFAAVRSDEFMHFGIALELWGTGAAQDAHDAVLDRMVTVGITRAWLRVFADNERGRRFYERLGWSPTGERSHSTFPPYAELLRYERGLTERFVSQE